jgi:hypothetical protein
MKALISALDHAFGRCPRCIRKAFLSALAAWLVTLLAIALGASPLATALFSIAALGFSTLWLAHLIAFASRTSIAATRNATNDDYRLLSWSRREAIPRFARALAFAAVSTGALPFIKPAFADSPCQNCQGCWNCCTCYQQVCANAPGCDITCVNNCNDAYKECIKKC